jgi:hypothetical protein
LIQAFAAGVLVESAAHHRLTGVGHSIETDDEIDIEAAYNHDCSHRASIAPDAGSRR